MFNKLNNKEKQEIYHSAQKELSDKLKAYHSKYVQEQETLKKNFDFRKLDKININIWDDFYDDGFAPDNEEQNTYAYIETEDIPDVEEKNILESLIDYIVKNSLLPNSTKVDLIFYDSSTEYPILVMEYEYNLYKRWQVEFRNITHKILDKLVEDLGNFPNINDIKVNIYSES